MTDMEFKPFQKIPRFFRDICITEKIDGTNAVVAISPDGEVFAGSRNRWVTPEKDNYGFAAWVRQNEAELKKLGPGYHYGEWWGRGIQRGYGLRDRIFSLFNADRWGDDAKRPACCHVVPVLYRGPLKRGTVQNILANLQQDGSKAAPGAEPEGIIIYHYASGQMFKNTLGGDGAKTGVRINSTVVPLILPYPDADSARDHNRHIAVSEERRFRQELDDPIASRIRATLDAMREFTMERSGPEDLSFIVT